MQGSTKNTKELKKKASTFRSKQPELFEKAKKEKKKRWHQKKKDSNNLATGVNRIEVGNKKKKKEKNPNKATYYNCNKKGHFSTSCP